MTNTKEGKAKTSLQLIVRIVVSTGLMVWLITMIDWDEAFGVMREGSHLIFFVAAFLAIQITVLRRNWEMENAHRITREKGQATF